jgi:hypothetical protein
MSHHFSYFGAEFPGLWCCDRRIVILRCDVLRCSPQPFDHPSFVTARDRMVVAEDSTDPGVQLQRRRTRSGWMSLVVGQSSGTRRGPRAKSADLNVTARVRERSRSRRWLRGPTVGDLRLRVLEPRTWRSATSTMGPDRHHSDGAVLPIPGLVPGGRFGLDKSQASFLRTGGSARVVWLTSTSSAARGVTAKRDRLRSRSTRDRSGIELGKG